METYYQKHKTIQATQFDGNWKTLLPILNGLTQVNLTYLSQIETKLDRKLIKYNQNGQIEQLTYIPIINKSAFNMWPHEHSKRKHRHNHCNHAWKKKFMYNSINHINKQKVKINRLSRYINLEFNPDGNELHVYHRKSAYRPIYKYYVVYQTLHLGDYLVISYSYSKRNIDGHHIVRLQKNLQIYRPEDFEAHWSEHPIRKV